MWKSLLAKVGRLFCDERKFPAALALARPMARRLGAQEGHRACHQESHKGGLLQLRLIAKN
jgi:hypothetical protein